MLRCLGPRCPAPSQARCRRGARGGDDVAGAGGDEATARAVDREPFGGQGIEEVVIGSVPMDLQVVLGRRAAGDPDSVAVPLGVRVVEQLLFGYLAQGPARLSQAGTEVGAPVDEDAQLGLGPPVRDRPAQVGPDRAVRYLLHCCSSAEPSSVDGEQRSVYVVRRAAGQEDGGAGQVRPQFHRPAGMRRGVAYRSR